MATGLGRSRTGSRSVRVNPYGAAAPAAKAPKKAAGREAINMPVTILTLRYTEGDSKGQMTFQLLPEELKKLSQACEQALR